MLFQTYLINRNWRFTQYFSTAVTSFLGLQWLLVFYNIWGLRNGWFTIFIALNQSFSSGICQVLFAMAVIELAKPGQEATTYEIVVSVANAAGTLNTIVATQLLEAVDSAVCNNKDYCPPGTVNLIGMVLFTKFLPKQKAQCHEWRKKGEDAGNSFLYGVASTAIAVLCITYGILCSIMLVNPKTACMKAFGGSGCKWEKGY